MSTQEESFMIAKPMNLHFQAMGWWVQNITPGFFINDDLKKISPMKGLPDSYIGKKGFIPRWVEYKVIRNNRIKFEDSQKEKFLEMHNAGIAVYILCTATPLMNDYRKRVELYEKVVKKEPNVPYMIAGMYEYLF